MLSQIPKYTFKQKQQQWKQNKQKQQGGSRERQGPGTHWLANLTYWVSTGPVRNNKACRLLRMTHELSSGPCAHMCTFLPAQKKCKVAPPPWKYLGWNTDPPFLLWHRELNTEGHATNCIWVFRVASFLVDQRWKWPKFSLILKLYSHAMDYLVIKKYNIRGSRDSSGGNTLVLQVWKHPWKSLAWLLISKVPTLADGVSIQELASQPNPNNAFLIQWENLSEVSKAECKRGWHTVPYPSPYMCAHGHEYLNIHVHLPPPPNGKCRIF